MKEIPGGSLQHMYFAKTSDKTQESSKFCVPHLTVFTVFPPSLDQILYFLTLFTFPYVAKKKKKKKMRIKDK